MKHSRAVRIAGALGGLALLVAACGDDAESSSTTTAGGDTTTTAASGGGGELAGMKGTTPLVDLSDDFKNRLLEVDPELVDFNYAAESYDATVIIALATAKAGTDGIEMASEINGITRGGEKCETFEACVAIIDAGGDPDYDGASGPGEFSGNGEPTVASYGILTYGDDNRIDDGLTEFVTANAPAAADVAQVPVEGARAGDGELKIGSILPETGSLAFLGPPEFAGVDLAAKEINEAGGVLGKPIVIDHGDSGDTSTDIANTTVDRLLAANVDAIIGAASSGVSATVIDKIAAAGVVQFSPANTSKAFSTYADKGLYFRDAPSDILQGQVLGEVIANDGHATVGILALDDPYGTGLAEDLQAALEASGIEVVESIIYDPGAQTFDGQVQDIVSADPDAIVIIGFDETSRILSTLVEQGVGPQDKAVYGVDGNMGNALGENFDAGK
jgi:ABC-type branched-subunit amino acid transport system substrate-binding protein